MIRAPAPPAVPFSQVGAISATIDRQMAAKDAAARSAAAAGGGSAEEQEALRKQMELLQSKKEELAVAKGARHARPMHLHNYPPPNFTSSSSSES